MATDPASLRRAGRRWLRAIGNRLRFPHARCGADSFLSRGCTLAAAVTIGRDCRIFAAHLGPDTHLGDGVVIGHRACVRHTRLGAGCAVEEDAELYGSHLAAAARVQTRSVLTDVRLGRGSSVARGSYLNDVTVGQFTSIGPRALLGCGDHPADLVSTSPAFYSRRGQSGLTFAPADLLTERRPITIGHDVWLGARVFVRDGIAIGDGAIVAAGAVVTADVPPYAIVGGVPARLIRFRFPPDAVTRLLALQWWHWDEPRLRASQPWFAQADIAAFLRHTTP